MIKIGLLNIHNVDNYGANLIAYSMEQELLQMEIPGAEVTTIDFCPNLLTSSRQADSLSNAFRQFGFQGASVSLKRKLQRIRAGIRKRIRATGTFRKVRKVLKGDPPADLSAAVREKDRQVRLERFEAFQRDCLHLSKRYGSGEMEELPYDIIIVGSDVVWKPGRLLAQEENTAYFQPGSSGCRRIAYAASIGMSDETVLKRLASRYREAVSRFDHISVRERSAQKYFCRLLPEREIENCIDPVFLRKPEDYRGLAEGLPLEKGPYIYVYLMGNNKKARHFARELASEKHLPIIFHMSYAPEELEGISSESDGPREFLHRIQYARYVVTDTFHGTALSILFRKQFLTFTRGNMSVRLEDFLSRMDLLDRFVEEAENLSVIDREVGYEAVSEKIDAWADTSRAWLQRAVHLSIEEK